MQCDQIEIKLSPKKRGFHLITDELISKCSVLSKYQNGIAHLFIKHTSASLTLNENADPSVRYDFEAYFRHSVPDQSHYFQHTLEGADDMTAHIKSSIMGTHLSIPIQNSRLALGTWQGIYLGEHRESAGSRTLLMTLIGNQIN